MYELHIERFGDFERYTFAHQRLGHQFSIVPAFGATLISLRFAGREVLDGYLTADDLVANKWSKSAVLCPFPNRLQDGQFTVNGTTYQFPLTNPATGNAIHGFVKDKYFEVVKAEASEAGAELMCEYDYDGSYEPYPFPFTLAVWVKMSGDNGHFEFGMKMTNTGKTMIPAGLGWHPYLKLADNVNELSLKMPPICHKVIVDDRMLPTGERTIFEDFGQLRPIHDAVLDNCFVLPDNEGKATVILQNSHGKLAYWQTTGVEGSNFVQVFTPPHRQSIAIEPMTCNVNAFVNGEGLVMLGSQTSVACICGFEWTENK